ncbi:hypothetical protein Tco_0648367 [Tanacetum coccineum]
MNTKTDVHQDELCPPNKRYDIMDENKKVDLENVQCPSESKILMNIITNHPLRFSIVASASVPWIYMAQFWHTLREDGSKYRLKFMLDRKELTFTLDDFRIIFHLPQANDNNQLITLAKIFTNIYYTCYGMGPTAVADNANVILLCARDAYHNLQDDDIMKNIFNSGRNKNKVGMRIPPWMITEEMKLTEHYKMYAKVFGLDVHPIQSQPTESTQGTHRTLSAPSLLSKKKSEEQEAKRKCGTVAEHLAAEEIEKLVEESENVDA